MPDTVAVASASDDRLTTLQALADLLVDTIPRAEVSAVPALAARLVDVLKRIGGPDPSALLWLREGLATAVDRLAEIQGQTDATGKPLPEAKTLAPTVRQLVAVVEALDNMPVRGEEVAKADELAARRRAKAGDPRASAGRRRSR